MNIKLVIEIDIQNYYFNEFFQYYINIICDEKSEDLFTYTDNKFIQKYNYEEFKNNKKELHKEYKRITYRLRYIN